MKTTAGTEMNEQAAAERAALCATPHGAELLALYESTAAAWDLCAETAGLAPDGSRDENRAAEAAAARQEALGWWLIALATISQGASASSVAVRDALDCARVLAREWGDDSYERAALDLLEVAAGGPRVLPEPPGGSPQ